MMERLSGDPRYALPEAAANGAWGGKRWLSRPMLPKSFEEYCCEEERMCRVESAAE